MALKDQITEDMKTAMRAKDSARLGTIRLLLSACKQKEVDERVTLDDAAVLAIIEKLVKQRKDSIAAFTTAQRQDLVDKEGAELAVLRGAADTLRRHRPVVVFEHGAGAAEHYEGDSGDLHDLLAIHAGLRIFDLAGKGPLDRATFAGLFTAPVWNFVACP